MIESELDSADLCIENKWALTQSLYLYLHRTARPRDWCELYVRAQLELAVGNNCFAAFATMKLLEGTHLGFHPFRRLFLMRLGVKLADFVRGQSMSRVPSIYN